MTEDASAARSARGARPLDLKARIRSQRSGEGKGGEFRGRAKFGWMPLSQEVRGRRCPSNHPPDDIHRLPTLIAFLLPCEIPRRGTFDNGIIKCGPQGFRQDV